MNCSLLQIIADGDAADPDGARPSHAAIDLLCSGEVVVAVLRRIRIGEFNVVIKRSIRFDRSNRDRVAPKNASWGGRIGRGVGFAADAPLRLVDLVSRDA